MKIVSIFLITIVFQIHLLGLQEITISGTGNSQKLLQFLATKFEELNPNTKIHIPNSIGTSGGIKNTALGKSDLGRTARKLKKIEEKYNLNYIEFAYSPVVFVTNPSVKNLTSITEDQLIQIYNGTISNWKDLNAGEGKIFVASREIGDSAKVVLNKHLTKLAKIKKPIGSIVFSAPEMLDTITKYKGTIGYMSYAQAVTSKLNILSLNGIKPTRYNIENNLYKLFLPFGIVYKGKLNDLSKNFISFLKSEVAKNHILKHGAIPE